jgi:hypothetical protein
VTSAIRRLVIYYPNASRAFRLITENTCDVIRPAEDLWPPGALHVDGQQNRHTRIAVISHAFTGAERTRAFAFWGASLGIALAAGPLGWRWVFLVNLPACILLDVEESRDPHAKQLDFPGILTFSLGESPVVICWQPPHRRSGRPG